MNPCYGNRSRLCRFIAEHLRITSPTVPAAFLIITCLAVLGVLSSLSCSSPTPPAIITRPPTETPTETPASTVSRTPIPTLFPPVTLREPENGWVFDYGSEVTLHWHCPYELLANEYYRLRVWAEGQTSSLFYHPEDHFHLPELSPGEYNWAVAVVRSIGQDMYELVSGESDWWGFTVAPPSPVVRSISPTNILKGTGGPVVISGENFTYSLALTISVPLRAAFVNSSTITATIPTTLEVGEYPVIVTDLNGKGVSFAFFTVREKPTLTPTRPPKTPTPMTSVYPPPVLGWGGIIGCNVTFRWEWPRTLAEDEWFAVRVGKVPDVPHSQVWVKERQFIYTLSDAGDYVWEVAVCRGDPATAVCQQLAVSARKNFSYRGSGCPIESTPKPTPP